MDTKRNPHEAKEVSVHYYETEAGIMVLLAIAGMYERECRETWEKTGRSGALHQAEQHAATAARLEAKLAEKRT